MWFGFGLSGACTGKIAPVGVDWGKFDAQTGIFDVGGHYELILDNGDSVFARTEGPGQDYSVKKAHLRVKLDTGTRSCQPGHRPTLLG